ncbi:hypothetical protein L6R29_15770 [Myxococcota bacterium]|nr:hypothetical protein [Myxococcota bacterium]
MRRSYAIILLGWCCLLVWAAPVQAEELGFLERFALSAERKAALKQLIPGTGDAYYFESLYLQHQNKLKEVDALLVRWRQRFPYDGRLQEIEHRQALLRYSSDPKAALDYLREKLNLYFGHQRRVRGAKPTLPTSLDQSKISRETLYKRAMRRYSPMGRFTSYAEQWLLEEKTELSESQRGEILGRVTRPDIKDLPDMIVRELQQKDTSISFGSRTIHGKLTLAQLDACRRMMPSLRDDSNFVRTYLERLKPVDDVDLTHDLVAREAHLKRVWEFAKKLGSVHAPLKLHVLYHWLEVEEQRGVYNRSRFVQYLRMPRQVSYLPYAFRRRHGYSLPSMGGDYSSITGQAAVYDDWALVQRFLQQYFVKDASYTGFSSLIDKSHLQPLFARTKLMAGVGSAERWIAMLSPSEYQSLRDRVDLDFARSNTDHFGVAQEVKLDLFLKNVKKLIVKVYRINAESYYRQHKKEVTTALNLDGLVANSEESYTYEEAPILRVRQSFSFPSLKQRGVYVIDFIGNGKSSRALIRKGKLFYLERQSVAGHIFTILDEEGKPAAKPSIWMDGREYTADKKGKIAIPYSNHPRTSKILLASGDFVSLSSFEHRAERYDFRVGFALDRESLLAGKKAKLLIRPSLSIHGQPAPLRLLEEVSLEMTATDRFHVSASKRTEDLKWVAGREYVHIFRVPEQASRLSFVLRAKVKNLATGKEDALSASSTKEINGIDRGSQLHALHLIHAGGAYAVELLDRNGQPIPDRVARITLKHRLFTDSVTVRLRTDHNGRVSLGALSEIEEINASSPSASSKTWPLFPDRTAYPHTIHARAGETISIPAHPGAALSSEHLAFFEKRGEGYLHDLFDRVRLEKGFFVLDDLKAGEYEIFLKGTRQAIALRVAKGDLRGDKDKPRDPYVVSKDFFLQHNYRQPVNLQTSVDAKQVTLQVSHATPQTRVHLIATRFWPEFDVYGDLFQSYALGTRSMKLERPLSQYATGRDIGDEYRYILDRKYAKKYPGNMLRRPGLLLNPWAVRSTQTALDLAGGGGGFGGRGGGRGGWGSGESFGRGFRHMVSGVSPNLDFLKYPSVVLENLTPNKQGQIVIDRALLKHHHLLHLVVLDDNQGIYRVISMPEVAPVYQDLRLIVSLPSKGHFTQQKQVANVATGGQFKLADITSSEMERLDSLERVFTLLQTLCSDSRLKDFAALMRWPSMTETEKLAFYGKHASHELNFFLFRHDAAFFAKVIRPYLANKYEKTFLDRWLLGEEVVSFLQPWAYSQLNVFERILLAQRIKGELPHTAQRLADELALRPMDPQAWSRLFDAVLGLRALDQSDDTGIRDAREKSMEEARTRAYDAMKERAADMPAPPPSMAAPSAPMPSSGAAGFAARYRRGRRMYKRSARPMKMKMADEEAAKPAEKKEDEDMDRRSQLAQFFRQKEKTQEWAENNYYKRVLAEQNAALIGNNRFWHALARHDGKGPFLSRYIVEASSNASEALLALAVLDLPWKAGTPKVDYKGRSLLLTAPKAMMIFHKQIRSVDAPKQKSPLLVSQGYFDAARRYQYVGGQRVERYVTEEFLSQKVYGTQVIITNPTAARLKLEVLLQIPQGAMPVANGRVTHTQLIHLGAYQTKRLAYLFYFPSNGRFEHFPVHVSQDGRLLAFAAPFLFKVVGKLSKIDGDSWEYISQEAPEEKTLAYLQKANLTRVNLADLAWRMKDLTFFQKALATLQQRHYFHPLLWSYSIHHNQPSVITEYLKHQDSFLSVCGSYLRSPLVQIDPVERKLYEHLEYRPLVNARAHALGKGRKILNDRFREQYQRLLKILSYKPALSAHDHIAVAYYLLLQDRTEEALARFALVDAKQLSSQIQYDYFRAYMGFFGEKPDDARVIAASYKDHPVPRWRKRFREVLSQLDEIVGKTAVSAPIEKTAAKDTSPSLTLKLEGRKLSLRFANLNTIQIRYYPMDVELLFSRSPFLRQLSGRFTVVKPAFVSTQQVNTAQRALDLELPAQFQNSNVMIEVSAHGLHRNVVSYANALDVQIFEQQGHLQVLHEKTQRGMSRVYVKVYARLNGGSVQFYKDGYTDLRGRFDYASLSTDTLDRVERFSVLILSEKEGAVVREISPPRQ